MYSDKQVSIEYKEILYDTLELRKSTQEKINLERAALTKAGVQSFLENSVH